MKDKGILGKLYEEANEGDLLSFGKWLAIFLLICAYLGLGGFYFGIQGKGCGRWGDTLEQKVFSAPRQFGCFARALFEVAFSPINSTSSAPSRPARRPSVRP